MYQVTLRIVQVNAVEEEYSLSVRLVNGMPILQNIPFRIKIQSKLLKYLRSVARRNDVNKPVMKVMKDVGSVFKPYPVDEYNDGGYAEITIREQGFPQLISSSESWAFDPKYLVGYPEQLEQAC